MWTENAKANFNWELENIPFKCYGDPNKTYSEFSAILSELNDKHFPMKQVNVDSQRVAKPWLSDPDFRELCKKKNNLFRMKRQYPQDVFFV